MPITSNAIPQLEVSDTKIAVKIGPNAPEKFPQKFVHPVTEPVMLPPRSVQVGQIDTCTIASAPIDNMKQTIINHVTVI